MTYTWNGTGFNEGFVASQFLTANNTSYFYEQNYNNFFVTDNTGYGFVSDTTAFITIGTIFTDEPEYSMYVNTFSTALLSAKLLVFQSNATNVINAYNQTPSAYVTTTLTQSASSTSAFTASQLYAPFLTNPQSNFAFSEILNNWNGGPQIIKNLTGILSNFQGIVLGSMQKTKAVVDFKTKLLRQTTAVADETSKIQQQVNGFLSTNTFSALASAFPNSGLPQFNQLLMNHNAALEKAICTLCPVAAKGASVEGIINEFLGGKIFNILSPMDKIIADINNSNNIVSNLIKSIPTNGFTADTIAPSLSAAYQSQSAYIINSQGNPQISSLNAMSSFTNQAVNLLNNIMSKVPITASLPAPNAVTNPTQILNTLISTAKQSYTGQSTTLTGAQQAIATLVNTIATTTSPASSMYNPPVNPAEPSQGGSLANIAPLNSIFGGTTDPTITNPVINIALDPDVSNNQMLNLIAQRNVDAPGIFDTVAQGNGINLFNPIPHTPRNTPVDGSLGTYPDYSTLDISTD
jgi:hypothetical protein